MAKDKASGFHVPDIKGSALEAPVRLIRVLAGVDAVKDPAWPDLRDLQMARNIVVHRGGARGDIAEHQREFDGLISRNESLGKGEDWVLGDELLVSTQYCLTSVATIEQFFKRLFTSLGLPDQGVTIEA